MDDGKMQRMISLLGRYGELCAETNVPMSLQAAGSGETLMRKVSVGVGEFLDLAYSDEWVISGFDWPSWDEGRDIAGDPERISQCDLETIRKLITAIVRNDRFCEGALASAWRGGTIKAILERINTLMDTQE